LEFHCVSTLAEAFDLALAEAEPGAVRTTSGLVNGRAGEPWTNGPIAARAADAGLAGFVAAGTRPTACEPGVVSQNTARQYLCDNLHFGLSAGRIRCQEPIRKKCRNSS
jgi:hypothetical protein